MAHKTLDAVVRKALLRADRVTDLLHNLSETKRILERDHRVSGVHNRLRIPRGVALVRTSGAGYALAGNSSSISSVATVGGLSARLTLSGSYFASLPLLAVTSPMCPGATVPTLITHTIESATSVLVSPVQLSGGSWGAVQADFAIELYAPPVNDTISPFTTDPLGYGAGLDPDTYNAIAQRIADTQNAVLAEHTSAGDHDAREIAKAWDYVAFDGGTTYASDGASHELSASYSRVSAGIVDVTLPAAKYLNTSNPEVQILTTPDTTDGNQKTSTVDEATLTNTGNYLTTFRVHLWQRSGANTWALTDSNFYWRLYTA